MTTFLLLRHAHSNANDAGILAGRIEGVSLSTIGMKQAQSLTQALKDHRIDRIVSSSLLRCRQTVEPLAKNRRKRIHFDANFLEMDYGLWSGKKLKDLSKLKSWKTIQKSPTRFTFPEGEGFRSAALRIERGLNRLAKQYPKETILIVTHGDIIKMALQLTSGGPLDNFQRFIVDTCSLSEIHWTAGSRVVIRTNTRLVKTKTLRKMKSRVNARNVLGGGAGV